MTSMAKIREVFDVNFFAQLEFTQLLLRPMMRRTNACIINVGSVMGLDLPQGGGAYGVQSGIDGVTQVLAAECGPLKIRVNAIAPGMVGTEMAKQMGDMAEDVMIAQSALKRLGTPDEIAQTAVFLASEGASFVNGQVIRIDGGKA